MSLSVFTLDERPDLEESVRRLDPKNLPDFLSHDAVNNLYWPRIHDRFPEFQLAIVENGEVIAAGNTIPLPWEDGNLPDKGWDAALESGFRNLEECRPNAVLSALLAMVGAGHQRRGLSRVVLEAMRKLAAKHGFDTLIAPVRPTAKSAYPLTPMENYVKWRRDSDGLLFDPWMRVHERLGAKVVRVASKSMHIEGSVAEWEKWAKMCFPESGEYVVEGALCPVSIDIERDIGVYVEPNVWMVHGVAPLPVRL